MAFLDQNPGLGYPAAAGLGLLVGSFLNVVILRLPRRLEWQWKRDSREVLGEPDHQEQHQPPEADHEVAGRDDHLGEGRQVGAEAGEDLLELRHHEDQQDRADQDRHRDDRGRVEQRLLDLALEVLDVFLVAGDGIEHRFQHARGFARARQVEIQLGRVAPDIF